MTEPWQPDDDDERERLAMYGPARAWGKSEHYREWAATARENIAAASPAAARVIATKTAAAWQANTWQELAAEQVAEFRDERDRWGPHPPEGPQDVTQPFDPAT